MRARVLVVVMGLGLRASAPLEPLVVKGEVGKYGGQLIVAQRSELKTFNPVLASDNASFAVIRRMMADLVTINRKTHETEPALARDWEVSPDGRRYTLHLRHGVKFSDGEPFDAADVVFSFEVYQDEALHSPQRDLLLVGGKPLGVRKLDSHTVVFDLAAPYGAGERLFDSIAMLPRHVLEKPYRDGKFSETWRLDTASVVGLGPFRFKEYVPGSRVVLERNPYYWKQDEKGGRLPYLDRLVFRSVPSEDAEVLSVLAGETQVTDRLSAANYAALEASARRAALVLADLGPGLEYNFFFFNLNDLAEKKLSDVRRKQIWFQDRDFRRALSRGIDREAIVRLVYRGRATPIATHVTPGNRLWVDTSLAPDRYSPDDARAILSKAGFRWGGAAALLDREGAPVEFSIVTSAGNVERSQIATLIQEDLRKIGIKVQIVPLEFRSLVDRIFNTLDYDAALLALGSGDVDPNPEMSLWLSSGATHLWHPGQERPATPWEAELDGLMARQLTETSRAERKKTYDRVQQIVARELPLVFLVSPNILVAADARIGNFRPAILGHYTLWNVDQLFYRY